MKSRNLLLVALGTTLIASVASADVTNTIVQVNATAAELTAAGFVDVGDGSIALSVGTECVADGCFTLAGYAGNLAERGYFQFRFQDFNYANYSGLFTVLDLNYGTSGFSRDIMIGLINAQTSTTGVTALLPSQAGNSFCKFDDFLEPSLLDAIVLNWFPSPGPSTPGLSQAFTFAWDVTGVGGFGFGDNGISVDGVYGVPAPGAIALLAFAGLAGRRRR
ncbi:MAG: hypothetical protein ACKO0W_11805 [Planctomycetota bacterium]